MAASQHLGRPGGSTYSSATLHVGDGTWDASTHTFLLPNIQGLNFATMRYNGMGNRFRNLPEYHTLIEAHGILATITFLGVVPAAILIASFYHPNPKLALRLHISLQILTILLSTVILVLGYFAVGPVRSLTNPHHGIGVAIYVLVLVQSIGGWLIHKIERGKIRYHIPIKLMLHQWVGRAIALLALAQIPIGLTLYGSPLVLFVLYALAMAALVVAYFTLTYQTKKRAAIGYDDRGSYVTGTQTDLTDTGAENHRHGRWAALTGALAGGTAVAAMRRRRSAQRADTVGAGVESRADSGSYLTEKQNRDNRGYRESSWRDRLFEEAATIGAFAKFRSFLNRGRDREAESDLSSRYRPPLGDVTQSEVHVNRMEEGLGMANQHGQQRALDSRGAPQGTDISNPAIPARPSRETLETDLSRLRRDKWGPFAGLASFAGLGEYFRKRRERKEQDRIERERQHEYDNERVFGLHEDPMLNPNNQTHPIPPIPDPRTSNYGYGGSNLPQQLPPPPTGPPRNTGNNGRGPHAGQVSQTYPDPLNRPVSGTYQPAENVQRGTRFEDNVNSSNVPRSGLEGSRSNVGSAIQQPPPVLSPGRNRNTSSELNDNIESPPVSVKVKMHNDGRRVTVQRLNQSEPAIERGAVANESGRQRGETEPMNQTVPGQQVSEPNLSSPQRGHYMTSPYAAGGRGNTPGDVASVGYDTGTDSYDTNRRRRRAERARQEQARQAARGGGGGGIGREVEFT